MDMTEENDSSTQVWMDRIRGSFRRHKLVYMGGVSVLIIANMLIGDGWWSFWPMFLWSLVFACHFFFYRALRADEDWADGRAMQLRSKSYDIDHIQRIEASFKSGTMPGRHDLGPPTEEAYREEDRER
ncbi:MAG: 2TM domain-containing protein [Alphaproteobacteria bacterium]|jgi:hypothetical protein|nr:2TM domain-containing protein [Alphaproteobacteria bacterium]